MNTCNYLSIGAQDISGRRPGWREIVGDKCFMFYTGVMYIFYFFDILLRSFPTSSHVLGFDFDNSPREI